MQFWGLPRGARLNHRNQHRPRSRLPREKCPVLCGILKPDPSWPLPRSDRNPRGLATPTEPPGWYTCALPVLSCCVRSLLLPYHSDSQLNHTHPVLGVLGAKGELFLRCEEVKGAPRQMEVTSRPQLCPGCCSGRPQPWGVGSFMRVEGQKAQGVIGGGCSPVLPRIQPHQLQIKGVDTVTLEDGVLGSSRAQPRRSPHCSGPGLLQAPTCSNTTGCPLAAQSSRPSTEPAPHLQGSPSVSLPI